MIQKSILTLLCALAVTAAFAAEPARKAVDAQRLRVVNKGWDNTAGPYTRIPAYLKDSVRADLWDRAKCSAGIAVRFATDSKKIGARYHLMQNFHMNHMADAGIKGSDLYIWEDSVWRHVNTIRPTVKDKATKLIDQTYVENLPGEMREYMAYLPLYDGVNDFAITVDPGANIQPGSEELISPWRKIVFYGTSIVQGGCASRPGMASSNILSRELNAEVINVGISGEGKQDACMARAMAQIPDVDIYLLDPVPNCTEGQCDTLTYDFVNILRQAHPQAAIVMVEGPIYPYARYDQKMKDYLPAKNRAYRRNYERLVADNPHNLYYVTSEGLDGAEDDGTVDAIHLTDLGFRHYADKLVPILQPIMQRQQRLRASRK